MYEVNSPISCKTQQVAKMIFKDNYCLRFIFFTNLEFQAERAAPCPSVKKSSSVYLKNDIDSSPVMAERHYISDSAPDQGRRNSRGGSIVQV